MPWARRLTIVAHGRFAAVSGASVWNRGRSGKRTGEDLMQLGMAGPGRMGLEKGPA
jgi:hypothetical protein